MSANGKVPSQVAFSLRALLRCHPLKKGEYEAPYVSYANWPYPGTEQYLNLSAGRICYIDEGEGRPIVFLHGFGAHLARFDQSINALTGGYRVLAYDHPGHGKSEKGHPAYPMSFMAQTLHEFLERLDLKDAVLVGQSMGGAIILRYLTEHHERVQNAVIVSSAGVRPPHSKTGQFFTGLFLATRLADYLYARALSYSARRRTEAVLKMIHQGTNIKQDPEWRAMRRTLVSATEDLLKHSLEEELHKIRAHLLIIWGKEDKLEPALLAERLHAKVPHSELVLLDECGHHPMLEQEETYLGLLQDYLKSD